MSAESSIKFGSLDRRHVEFRVFVPHQLCRYDASCMRFRLSLARMLAPTKWAKCILGRCNWGMRIGPYQRHTNSRCYCNCGSCWNGNFKIAGWTICWWYSRFDGLVPCDCDESKPDLAAQHGEVETEAVTA